MLVRSDLLECLGRWKEEADSAQHLLSCSYLCAHMSSYRSTEAFVDADVVWDVNAFEKAAQILSITEDVLSNCLWSEKKIADIQDA